MLCFSSFPPPFVIDGLPGVFILRNTSREAISVLGLPGYSEDDMTLHVTLIQQDGGKVTCNIKFFHSSVDHQDFPVVEQELRHQLGQ